MFHSVRVKEIDSVPSINDPELLQWLRDNASGKWFRIEDTRWLYKTGLAPDYGSLYYFERLADAVYFKLRWCDWMYERGGA